MDKGVEIVQNPVGERMRAVAERFFFCKPVIISDDRAHFAEGAGNREMGNPCKTGGDTI